MAFRARRYANEGATIPLSAPEDDMEDAVKAILVGELGDTGSAEMKHAGNRRKR
jgi:hypothetical protein